MDLMKNNTSTMKKEKGKMGKGRRSSKQNTVKVVYISTPMKVKTSASRFMKIVQELTGRESDVVGIMETCGAKDTWKIFDCDHDHHDHRDDHDLHGSSLSSSSEEHVVDHGVMGRGQEESGPFDLLDYHSFPFTLVMD